MQVGLTPSLSFQIQQARQNAEIRAELQKSSQEAVTGRSANPLEATRGRIGDALTLQSSITDVARHRAAGGLAGARIDGASSAVALVREAIVGLAPEGRAALAQADSGAMDAVRARAEGTLSQMFGVLNQRQGERYLFSGTQTNTAPLSGIDQLLDAVSGEISAATDAADAQTRVTTFFDDPSGGFTQDIYQGSTGAGPRLHISDNQSLSPLPKADDPVFKDIMQGLAMISESISAGTEAEQKAIAEAGMNLIDTGLENLLRIEARLGATRQNVDQIDSALQAEEQLLTASEQRLLGVDTFEAAARLQALEGQLQASYTITGRLGSLNLTNFLR